MRYNRVTDDNGLFGGYLLDKMFTSADNITDILNKNQTISLRNLKKITSPETNSMVE